MPKLLQLMTQLVESKLNYKIEFCLQFNLLIWFRLNLTNCIEEKFVIIKLIVYACMQASVSLLAKNMMQKAIGYCKF